MSKYKNIEHLKVGKRDLFISLSALRRYLKFLNCAEKNWSQRNSRRGDFGQKEVTLCFLTC